MGLVGIEGNNMVLTNGGRATESTRQAEYISTAGPPRDSGLTCSLARVFGVTGTEHGMCMTEGPAYCPTPAPLELSLHSPLCPRPAFVFVGWGARWGGGRGGATLVPFPRCFLMGGRVLALPSRL